MNSKKANHNRIKHVLAFVLALSIIGSLVTSVYATNNVDSLEQSATELENELSSLDNDLKKLSKDINSISSQISDMDNRIKDVRSELAIAKGKERAQYATMKTRIQFMYENGNHSLLETLFSSASLAEFIKRTEYISTMNAYDRNALRELSQTQETISQRESQLEQEKKSLSSLLKELDAKETALRSKVDTASEELKTYTEKLEKARKEAQKVDNTLNKDIKPVTPSKQDKEDTKPSVPKEDYVATSSELELFAALIECEAGSTNYDGMLAVASVVVNRMNHSAYPNTIRGVILASGQFPPATNGKVDKVLKRGIKDSCLQAANDALAGKNNVGSCLNFRAASSGHAGTIIGDNVFF